MALLTGFILGILMFLSDMYLMLSGYISVDTFFIVLAIIFATVSICSGIYVIECNLTNKDKKE